MGRESQVKLYRRALRKMNPNLDWTPLKKMANKISAHFLGGIPHRFKGRATAHTKRVLNG